MTAGTNFQDDLNRLLVAPVAYYSYAAVWVAIWGMISAWIFASALRTSFDWRLGVGLALIFTAVTIPVVFLVNEGLISGRMALVGLVASFLAGAWMTVTRVANNPRLYPDPTEK